MLKETERIMQREKRRKKVTESRYNKWYKLIKGKSVPRYLKKG